jgi:hypothetical protein
LFEVQKQQALTQETINIEKAKSQLEMQKLQTEAQLEMQLMQQKFQYDMQLEQLRSQSKSENLKEAEDRKDERTRIQASQQSEIANQRKNNALPLNFESSEFTGLQGMGI